MNLIEANKVKQEDLIIEKRMHEFVKQEIHSALEIVRRVIDPCIQTNFEHH